MKTCLKNICHYLEPSGRRLLKNGSLPTKYKPKKSLETPKPKPKPRKPPVSKSD